MMMNSYADTSNLGNAYLGHALIRTRHKSAHWDYMASQVQSQSAYSHLHGLTPVEHFIKTTKHFLRDVMLLLKR